MYYIVNLDTLFKKYWTGYLWTMSYKDAFLYYTKNEAHRAMKNYQGRYKVEQVQD